MSCHRFRLRVWQSFLILAAAMLVVTGWQPARASAPAPGPGEDPPACVLGDDDPDDDGAPACGLAVQDDDDDSQQVLHTQVVCAPGTHPTCLPGPYTLLVSLSGRTQVTIDVYLEHTGSYEPNEQSSFYSPLGDILDCGPVPQGAAEVYCGTVTGIVDGALALTVEHSGDPGDTGSHRQRYEVSLTPACTYPVYLPLVPNYP